MATMNDVTTNFDMPLPHPQNHMADDCQRIRQAIQTADAEIASVKKTADAALPKSGGTMTGALRLPEPAASANSNEAATAKFVNDRIKQTIAVVNTASEKPANMAAGGLLIVLDA